MALTPGDPCLQTCPNCGTLVDITEQEPLSKFECPTCGTTMRTSRQYNHFSIIEHLGTGGMGSVYKAMDRNLNRMVALKLLRRELSADETYIAKLEDEARITASINHPFVVKVFSFGVDHGQYYIAMELVDKGTLDDLMQLQNRIAEMQVLQVGLQVASGLQAAHERGLIHRDVKPGNILFADAHTAKITDFGLALLAEHEADARGEIWGTPYYIAPEKLSQQPEDFRSDIYSLGGTLFHAVAGRPPFEAETASLVALKHLKSKAVSLQAFAPDVSSETSYVINRMLNKDPNGRYASYGDLIDHLRYAIEQLGTKTGKTHAGRQRVVVESQSQNQLAGALTLLLLALMVAGGILAYSFRAKLFGTGGSEVASHGPTNALVSGPDAKALPEALYEEARHQIVAGKYTDAEADFAHLAMQPNLPQPLRNWVKLHQGMTAFLNHQVNDARGTFASLHDAGLFSNDDKQLVLANFFVETGRFLATDQPVPATVLSQWKNSTFEDFALLLFGLKDWELGDFGDANALFDAYLGGSPPEPYHWITEYAPIARKAVHDYALYAPLEERLKTGETDKAALKADFAKARGQLQTSGKLVETFYAAEANLDKGQAPAELAANSPAPVAMPAAANPTPTPTAAANTLAVETVAQKAETVRWQTARESYQQLVTAGRFDEALSVIDNVKLTQPAYQQARTLIDLRARLMIAFKKTMLNDLKVAGGYPLPVNNLSGVAFPRGIKGVDGDMLLAGTPYGQIGVPWTDFSPSVYLAVAMYYADASRNSQQAATRRWMAANYALENGRSAEARSLANLAARDQPQYRKDLAQFNEPSAAR